jgi:hypothetical protein
MRGPLDIASRSSLMIAVGAALIALPLAAALSTTAIVVGLVAGALAVTLGLAGTAQQGRGTLPLSAQAAFDRTLGAGLLVTAVAFRLAGERGGLTLFGVFGLLVLAVSVATRYTRSPVST